MEISTCLEGLGKGRELDLGSAAIERALRQHPFVLQLDENDERSGLMQMLRCHANRGSAENEPTSCLEERNCF